MLVPALLPPRGLVGATPAPAFANYSELAIPKRTVGVAQT